MDDSILKAESRTELGSRATAKLRESGRLPVNIYGHKQDNVSVSFEYREFEKFFNQGHRMLTVDIDGKQEHGVIREVQYDYLGTDILHVDIARIDLTEEITMNVPIETLGTSKGVTSGGSLNINLRTLQITGIANKIPEKVEVNISELDLNDSIHVSDLEVPEGCTIENDPSSVIVVINITRASGLAEEGEQAGEDGETAEGGGTEES